MKRYHVYKWTNGKYILIDTKTNETHFYPTNYENKMGAYHLENPKVEKISKQKVSGLMKRINKGGMNPYNSYAIDCFIYHLLMSEEQRKDCMPVTYFGMDINNQEFLTSGDDFESVTKEMQRIVNDKVVVA